MNGGSRAEAGHLTLSYGDGYTGYDVMGMGYTGGYTGYDAPHLVII